MRWMRTARGVCGICCDCDDGRIPPGAAVMEVSMQSLLVRGRMVRLALGVGIGRLAAGFVVGAVLISQASRIITALIIQFRP